MGWSKNAAAFFWDHSVHLSPCHRGTCLQKETLFVHWNVEPELFYQARIQNRKLRNRIVLYGYDPLGPREAVLLMHLTPPHFHVAFSPSDRQVSAFLACSKLYFYTQEAWTKCVEIITVDKMCRNNYWIFCLKSSDFLPLPSHLQVCLRKFKNSTGHWLSTLQTGQWGKY